MTAFLGEGEGGEASPSRVYFGSAFASRGLRLHTPRPPRASISAPPSLRVGFASIRRAPLWGAPRMVLSDYKGLMVQG